MKRSCILVLILVLMPVLAFGDTVKIGLAHVFSGPMATFGDVAEQGVRLAVSRINEQGGLLGRNLEVVKADTQAKPDAGLKAVEKLVTEDRVDAIVGMVSSAVALKVVPEMDRFQTPLIITHAMADAVTGSKCSPWVFRMTWSTTEALRGAALLAKSELKSDTWTTLGPDYGFGQECWELFQKNLGELGPVQICLAQLVACSNKGLEALYREAQCLGGQARSNLSVGKQLARLCQAGQCLEVLRW